MSKLCILALLLVVAAGLQPGCCCVYSPDQLDTVVRGKPVPDDALRRVEIGTTTKWWLLRFLGRPSRVERQPDGAELLTYEYAQTTEDRLAVGGIALRRRAETRQATVFFELERGVVRRTWQTPG